MTAAPIILYRFHIDDHSEEIRLTFDVDSFVLKTAPVDAAPPWAALDFHKCPHCPLVSADTPHCPFALALSGYVEAFSHLESYREARIEVITPSRTIAVVRPLESGIASLVGLIGATSGCPHLAFYRPMARFHLPFAEEEETLYRVLSLFLMRAYVDHHSTELTGLSDIMAAVGIVNLSMADRIRAGFTKDAMVNAIVILDYFAVTVPMAIDRQFDALKKLL